MNIFLPKFLQRKPKNQAEIKCVGTSDEVNISRDADSLIAQPSMSDVDEDSETFNNNIGTNNSSFISQSRYGIYPQCCSKHLIDSSYKNFKFPTHDDMMYRRLELYFKKYPGRSFKNESEIKFVEEKNMENEEMVKLKCCANRESLIPTKCSSPDETNRGYPLRGREKSDSIKMPVNEKLSTFEIRKHIVESRGSDFRESGCCGAVNLSRQPSNVTTRSSQEIFYTAASNINSRVNSIDDVDVSNKSGKNSKSSSASYCTTYEYSSSRSYCDEIAKLNIELSPNSQSRENYESTKNSLNWNTTINCDNASTVSKSKANLTAVDIKNIESDNITSLTNENITNNHVSNEQFTNISILSDKDHNWSFPSTDVTKVSPIKVNSSYESLYYKKLLNKSFEKFMNSINSTDKSQNDSFNLNLSKNFKSLSQSASKLPRRKYKRSSSLISDLGTLDRFTYLSSLDESESYDLK